MMRESIQIQMIRSQTVLWLAADALLHYADLRRTDVVGEIAVGRVRPCQNL